MLALRSLAFNLCFYLATTVIATVGCPLSRPGGASCAWPASGAG